MATKSDLFLTIEQFLDTTRNWNLSRRYTASLAERTEGFTEKFGDHRRLDGVVVDDDDDKNAPLLSWTTANCWRQEQESVEFICATDHPPESIRLIQYRPAWLEQLALRIAGIPHVVVNSHYAVMEAVGPLPCLQDLANHPPAMVARRLNPPISKTDNAILDYLKQSHGFDLDQHLPPDQHHQAFSYRTLIHQTIEPCSKVLQFTDDEAVWSQITRQRCIQAGSSSSSSSNAVGRSVSSFLAFLQARSERIHELGRLSAEHRALSTEEAIQRIRACYQVFESILSLSSSADKNDTTTPSYLCRTATPCFVDVLLWDHLMYALTDIHLVVVLAGYPALIGFVANIWEEYFARKKASPSLQQPSNDWKMWNVNQNELNAFCNIPSLVESKTKNIKKSNKVIHFQHAIDLMEHLFVRDRNLGESLQVAKEARSLQDDAARRKGRMIPFQTWHRWRMGGTLYPLKDDGKSSNTKDPASEQERKLRKEYQKNDEMWMATVATATTIAFLLFGLATPKQE